MWRQKIFSSCSHLAGLEVLKAVLGPLSDFTDELSAEHHVSVSAILPVLKTVLDDVCSVGEDDTPDSRY